MSLCVVAALNRESAFAQLLHGADVDVDVNVDVQ